ncbi:MAG: lipopolysaccharide heptosyltransferase II [Sedimentisphaerales bacterium]|nr:lipopolysaccharide heptosyltransferase II [Sedimentisphaerales bacterium]
MAQVKTLAVRCPNWVGDIVMATPVFECLRANLPQARIVGVLKKSAQGILRDSPWFDEFVDLGDKSWASFRAMRARLHEVRPDAAILLANSLRSALTMRLSGVKTLYGYRREWRSPLLAGGPTVTRNGDSIVPIPMTEYYLGICRWLGLEVPSQTKPKLFIGDALRRRGEALLSKYGVTPTDRLIGLNPGASFGSSKCWPAEYFAEVARRCRTELNAKVIVFSGPGEDEIVQAILDAAQTDLIDTRPDKVDLELLKPLVRRCDLMITNDTGPRHYAVALDVPTVVIMGPTDPRYTNANLDRTIVVRKELACAPCHKKVCPKQHECMKEIKPAEVFDAAQELLKTNTPVRSEIRNKHE